MTSIWFCIFAVLLKLQFLEALSVQSANPGSGFNYYGKAQKKTLLTPAEDFVFNFAPRDCLKAPKNSTCIEDPLFNDPNLVCQLLDPPPCDPTYPYRHFDGKCNHPNTGKIGMSGMCYLRFLPPEYDGYGGIRKSASGDPLPEPRTISLRVFTSDKSQDVNNVTFLFALFGQTMAHDLARAVRPFKINCCAPENSNNPECLPIKISPRDPFYSKFKKTCIDFHRSEECKYCVKVTRAQTNGATAALDASFLYGENKEKAEELRAFNGKGELKYDLTSELKYDRRSYLPIVGVDKEDEFCYKGQETKCLLNGDPRVNMHASLGSFMTLWMREHNRIAERLKEINPDWEEEELFQESRKILITEFQCIAYKHFLPILLGVRVLKEFGTFIPDGSVGSNFDPTVVLSVWNEFAVAAFRLHSLVPSDIGFGHLLKDTFSNPDLLRQGYSSDILNGSLRAAVEEFDNYLVEDVSKYLYLKLQDLVSINIQRGRDHGLAPYVDAITFCSGQSIKIKNFVDLCRLGLMKIQNVRLLRRTYKKVRDIDLWVGMQLENHMNGSLIGPTAVCFIAKQLYFTMHGDRFFFNHVGLIPTFTEDQRIELKKCSIARVLCDNANITKISRNPFFLPNETNPEVQCEEIPEIDLSLWKNNGPKLEVPGIALPSKDDPNLPVLISV